jgi:hypothetical protein
MYLTLEDLAKISLNITFKFFTEKDYKNIEIEICEKYLRKLQ